MPFAGESLAAGGEHVRSNTLSTRATRPSSGAHAMAELAADDSFATLESVVRSMVAIFAERLCASNCSSP